MGVWQAPLLFDDAAHLKAKSPNCKSALCQASLAVVVMLTLSGPMAARAD
jgi:hypothetical protein